MVKGAASAKKEIDPEESLRRKFRAKCLFRGLGRLVMMNAYWLIEAVDHYEGVDDVKRRVEQAVRGKAKKKQLLNINDKGLLNKPAEDRTESEKIYLYRIIGGLKCFKRYPNHVKRKLAAVTYFKYYGPGRTIVRQHQSAHALYFIVTGDVTVSQMIWDELLQTYVSVEVGMMHAGDMFGEVSLLHNIPRTATVTTNGHCEFLALMKHDFKSVLLASVQKQWDEVRQAMSAFTYFDGLDDVARREGCIVAKMKTYEINDTLLGDGQGIHNFVYFVLSGQCQMIESMRVLVTKRLGREFYTLYDPVDSKKESDEDINSKYFGAPSTSSTAEQKEEESEEDTATLIENVQKIKFEEDHQTEENVNSKLSGISEHFHELSSKEFHDRKESFRLSVAADIQPIGGPQNLKTYFMQVCRFNAGASFGFGENMRDRRIIALTPVSCMLMPKVWLLQKNVANIWTRIEHYLDKKIPKKKQIFKEFVAARRWNEFRESLVEDVVSRSKTVNYTTIHDVPYSIRIEEMLDI